MTHWLTRSLVELGAISINHLGVCSCTSHSLPSLAYPSAALLMTQRCYKTHKDERYSFLKITTIIYIVLNRNKQLLGN